MGCIAEHDKSDADPDEEGDDTCMMTREQMFSEESDCDGFWCFESILLILSVLYIGSTPQVFIGPKSRCILYASATYTQVYTVGS